MWYLPDLKIINLWGLCRCAQCHHSGPYMGQKETEEWVKKHLIHLCWPCRQKGHEPKECGWPLKAGKGRKNDSPLDPPERKWPCWHLGFSPVTPASDFWLPECMIIHGCCLNKCVVICSNNSRKQKQGHWALWSHFINEINRGSEKWTRRDSEEINRVQRTGANTSQTHPIKHTVSTLGSRSSAN